MLKRVVHPGEILSDELAEFGITPTAFARQINVPPNRISQIIAGRRSVTGDTALRFGHWFGVDPQFWLNLQTQFDLAIADQQVGEAVRELPTASARRQPAAQQAGVRSANRRARRLHPGEGKGQSHRPVPLQVGVTQLHKPALIGEAHYRVRRHYVRVFPVVRVVGLPQPHLLESVLLV